MTSSLGLEAMEQNLIAGIVQRGEEGQSLDVVPMKVGQEDHQMLAVGGSLLSQPLAQAGDAGAAVQDDGVFPAES